MISSDVLLGSQDILDDSSWGPQKRFFGFSFGGYVEGGAVLACFDQLFNYFDVILVSFKTWMGSYNFVHLIHIK